MKSESEPWAPAMWINRLLAGVGVLVVLAGCSTGLRPGAPGPGVPVISNLRFEPAVAKPGQEIRVSFEFEDADADVTTARFCYVRTERWSRVTVTVGDCRPIPVEPSSLTGRAVGLIKMSQAWSRPARYSYEVHVADSRGHESNVLRGSVIVRH